MNELMIRDWKVLEKPDGLEGHWIVGEEIGKHLGYSEPRKNVSKIYERNQKSFMDAVDTGVVKLTTPSGTQETRIYSERGCLKIARFSRTDQADKIMDEVFDIFLEARNGKSCIPASNHPLMIQARQMMEITARWVQVEEEQARQARKLHEIECKQDAILSQSGYYSIMGYTRIRGIKISLKTAANLGRLASTISRQRRIAIDSIPDPRFGRINTYHETILQELFPNCVPY